MSSSPHEGEYYKICESGICGALEMYQKQGGRKYVVRTWHKGIERKWCSTCIRIQETTSAAGAMAAQLVRESLLRILKASDKDAAIYAEAKQWRIEL